MTAPEPDLPDTLFDVIDVGLILLDGEQRVAGWNGWMEHASGISEAAARGRRFEEVFPGTPPRLRTAISHALELGASSLITHSLHPTVFPLRTRALRERR